MSGSPLTSQNTVAWHGRHSGEHKARLDEWAAKGFRTLSLSIYDDPDDPLYAAVMVKRPHVIAERQFFTRSQAQIQHDFDEQAKQGLGPYVLTATGSSGSATFAGCFTPMPSIPLTRLNLTQDAFEALNESQHAAGNILSWYDVFGDGDDLRFCAIWVANPNKTVWSIHGYDPGQSAQALVLDGTLTQQRFDALTSSGARLMHTAMTPSGAKVQMFTDSTIGSWASRSGITAQDYQAEYDKQSKAGLQPLQVSAKGSGGSVRFAAIFTAREDTDPRAFRAQGPVSVAPIDQFMKSYMAAEDLRGAALAICKGTQLVYAKGYTFAEVGYPDLTPTTPFRQASVSKTFTGVAMWRLMQLHSTITPSTTLQSILHLKQPDGSAPADSRFGDITLKHLLESDSGLPQGLAYDSVGAAAAFNAPLPATLAQMLSYATTFQLTGAPGNKNNSVYGNFDYQVLSAVVAKLQGTATYYEALDQLVLKPLGIKHTHAARSLIGDQPAGDARHHMRIYDPGHSWPLYPFEVLPSVRHPDQHIVASQYGNVDYEMFCGAGGTAASIVDVARLAAMFSCRSGNPVLDPAHIDSLLNATVAAGALKGPDGKGSHGYYGLDWAAAGGGSPPSFTVSKGGWLPAQGTVVQFTTGGWTYAIALNGNADAGTDWMTPVANAAAAHDWGSADLFHSHFGMAKLAATAPANVAPAPAPPVVATQRMIKDSMTAGLQLARRVRR